jgi:light-harvesting complex I chlorophyll a/b binding protein 1
LSEELGVSGGIFGNKLFDPLQLATEENFVRYREAELKHGRVAMLATVGMIFPEILLDTKNILFSNKLLVFLSPSQKSLTTLPSGIRALSEVPTVGWLPMVAFVAFLELFVLKQRSKTALPGDYGTGFFGLHDYGKHERLLQRELEYGRLAMLGFVMQVIWELATDTSVVEPYRDFMNYILGALH